MLVRLPNAVPLVFTDWTTDWLLYWVRPPAALARSIWTAWVSMPRASAQVGGCGVGGTVTATGGVPEAWMVIEVGLVRPNRPPVLCSLPSVVKVTMPVLIRPLPLLARSPGLARSSAYHWFGPGPFSIDRVTVRWP